MMRVPMQLSDTPDQQRLVGDLWGWTFVLDKTADDDGGDKYELLVTRSAAELEKHFDEQAKGLAR